MLSATVNLYRNAYTGLTRRMWLLAIVMLINRSGTMVLAFMTLYINHIGFSTELAGLVVGVYGTGSLIGAFIGVIVVSWKIISSYMGDELNKAIEKASKPKEQPEVAKA